MLVMNGNGPTTPTVATLEGMMSAIRSAETARCVDRQAICIDVTTKLNGRDVYDQE